MMAYALLAAKMIYQDSLNKKKFFYAPGSCKPVGACLPFIRGYVLGL